MQQQTSNTEQRLKTFAEEQKARVNAVGSGQAQQPNQQLNQPSPAAQQTQAQQPAQQVARPAGTQAASQPATEAKKPEEESKVEAVPSASKFSHIFRLHGLLLLKQWPDGKSETIFTMPQQLYMPQIVQVSDSTIYLIGGTSDVKQANPLDTCYKIDTESKPIRAQEIAKMSEKRWMPGTCLSRDKKRIYVCGGLGENGKVSKTCEFFCLTENKWKKLNDMNTARHSFGLCEFAKSEHDRGLYAFGGLTDASSARTADIEVATLSNSFIGQWQTISYKLPGPTSQAGAFQFSQNSVLVLGGVKEVKDNSNSQTRVVSITDGMLLKIDQRKQVADSKVVKLDHPDFFSCIGTVLEAGASKVQFLGSKRFHTLSVQTLEIKSEAIAKI